MSTTRMRCPTIHGLPPHTPRGFFDVLDDCACHGDLLLGKFLLSFILAFDHSPRSITPPPDISPLFPGSVPAPAPGLAAGPAGPLDPRRVDEQQRVPGHVLDRCHARQAAAR